MRSETDSTQLFKALPDSTSSVDHWQAVYESTPGDELGWFDAEMSLAMDWIGSLNLEVDSAIIDIGGGSCFLVDHLIASGFSKISVLDISNHALQRAKKRLGDKAGGVTWIAEDVLSAELPIQHFDLWHDRAMFHFLTTDVHKRVYLKNLSKSLKLGGYVILGIFSPEAPPKCSGLPVNRYSLDEITETFGTNYILEHSQLKLHVTPSGVEQLYQFCLFRKIS